MNIDYHKIITTDFNDLVKLDDYNEIKEEFSKERKYLLRNYMVTSDITQYLANFANERAYILTRNQDKSNAEKALIAANINYEDEMFCDALLKNNLDYEFLNNYIKTLNYLKVKTLTRKLTDNDKLYEKKIQTISKKIVNIMTSYFGQADINIIINKINEMLSYRSDLLIKKNNVKGK